MSWCCAARPIWHRLHWDVQYPPCCQRTPTDQWHNTETAQRRPLLTRQLTVHEHPFQNHYSQDNSTGGSISKDVHDFTAWPSVRPSQTVFASVLLRWNAKEEHKLHYLLANPKVTTWLSGCLLNTHLSACQSSCGICTCNMSGVKLASKAGLTTLESRLLLPVGIGPPLTPSSSQSLRCAPSTVRYVDYPHNPYGTTLHSTHYPCVCVRAYVNECSLT